MSAGEEIGGKGGGGGAAGRGGGAAAARPFGRAAMGRCRAGGSGRSLGLRLRRAAAAAPCGGGRGRRGRAGECGTGPFCRALAEPRLRFLLFLLFLALHLSGGEGRGGPASLFALGVSAVRSGGLGRGCRWCWEAQGAAAGAAGKVGGRQGRWDAEGVQKAECGLKTWAERDLGVCWSKIAWIWWCSDQVSLCLLCLSG